MHNEHPVSQAVLSMKRSLVLENIRAQIFEHIPVPFLVDFELFLVDKGDCHIKIKKHHYQAAMSPLSRRSLAHRWFPGHIPQSTYV